LARLARNCDAAIVHTNTLAAISGPVAALLARKPHVWQVHEVIADEHWFVRLAYRLLALLPGRLIANSNATARSLAGPVHVVRRKTRVVYPGLVERRKREPRAAGSDVLRVAFAGRLAPRKGIAELLEAIALVRSRGVDVRLQVFGSAPPGQGWREAQYRQQAAALGMADVVQFEGFVADVPHRLERIDVLVVPSQRPEPFGLVVLEGMAAGCAVVACRNGGGSDEILEHGVTGLYCGRTPTSIAAAIERLAHEPALRERLGDSASRAVGETYGVNRYVDGILTVYHDIFN
jgi:glycosyltransferase involved in cell wall biosynthesis